MNDCKKRFQCITGDIQPNTHTHCIEFDKKVVIKLIDYPYHIILSKNKGWCECTIKENNNKIAHFALKGSKHGKKD